MRKLLLTPAVLLLFFTSIVHAVETPEGCAGQDMAETTPRPVNLPEIYKAVEALPLLLTDERKVALASLFNSKPQRTKMDQFYRMLFLLAQWHSHMEVRPVILNSENVRQILKVSKVIENPAFLEHISAVEIDWNGNRNPKYKVSYTGNEVALPLNQGRGFSIYRNGLCQSTQALLFHKNFSFRMKERSKKNLLVYDFEGVDMLGVFGSRGVIDVDLKYVTLGSVEFIDKTNLGIVKAKVARREFEENDHNWLLRVVTRFVGDTSTQPIDW